MGMTPIQARVAFALALHHGHGWTLGVRALGESVLTWWEDR